jgi:hypothetical protein
MTRMLSAVVSWPTFLIAVAAFGFAPGALLRVIVLAFPRGDPRRQELIAELYAVPRRERPFWVAQQLEVAIFEGLGERVYWAATGRIIHRWHLRSGVELHRAHPQTFDIPDDELKSLLIPGDSVKVMFEMRDGWCERMWVQITKVSRRRIRGTLENLPVGIPRLMPGDTVRFSPDHVIDIDLDDATSEAYAGYDQLGGQLGGQTA